MKKEFLQERLQSDVNHFSHKETSGERKRSISAGFSRSAGYWITHAQMKQRFRIRGKILGCDHADQNSRSRKWISTRGDLMNGHLMQHFSRLLSSIFIVGPLTLSVHPEHRGLLIPQTSTGFQKKKKGRS
jgi:hypothetical protein